MPIALYVFAVAVFVMGTSEFMLAGLLPDIAGDLGVQLGAAALLNSAFAVGMVLGAPVMAALARRLPPHSTMQACLIGFAAAHAIGAITDSFGVLLVVRVFSALANAGFLAVALTVSTSLARGQTARGLSILLSGTTIATVAGVPLGAFVGAAAGWRVTFWGVAILCAPVVVGIALVSRREVDVQEGSTDSTELPLVEELRQLGNRAVRRYVLLAALVNAGTFGVFTFLAPVTTDSAGLAEHLVPVVLVAFGLGSFVGVTVAGRLGDRLTETRWVECAILLPVGWSVLAFAARAPLSLITVVFVQGALAFALGSVLIARLLDSASGAPNMKGAFATAALNIGAAAGPVLAAQSMALGVVAPIWLAAALSAVAVMAWGLSARTDIAVRPPARD